MDSAQVVVVGGYIDPRSGIRCGWANATRACAVPDCKFPSERCVCVQREHGKPRTTQSGRGHGVQIRALICALEEERGHMIVALYDLDTGELEALMEAAQLIDTEAQEILAGSETAE